MDDGHTWYLLITLLLLALCCYFTASASAIVGVNDSNLKERSESGDKKAKRLYDCLHNSNNFVDRVRGTAWICGTAAAGLGTARLSLLFFKIMLPGMPELSAFAAALSMLFAVLLSVFAVVSIGFKIPQLLGSRYCEPFGYKTAGLLRVLMALFTPLGILIRGFSYLISKLFGADPSKAQEEITEEEIRMLVDVGNEIGFIEESQKEMINNIFEFDDTTAGEVMTHRTEIIAVEKNAKISEIVYLAINEGFSRLPVYEKDLDNIIGLIYVKDLLCLVGCNSSEDFKTADFIRSVLFVPESTKCRALFAEFKKSKAHMAVVVDEYGGTAGIVSMEDILESIVGDIEDEYDEQEEDIQQIAEDTYIMDGTTDLEDVGSLLGLSFEEDEDFDTLGGFIIHMLGRIPKDDETPLLTFSGYQFTVLSMDERRIDKVKVQKLQETLPIEEEIIVE